ncbi:Enzymatic polyprotein [Cucumis melo var. makuwa]|uniref:Enzymatic polyprotein n=1 Tax=Cucumis melo var. makuwa TaxID=1194695 RepID=A0A5D3DZV1_CUCMM|nr:Enzymatic polyprotein [Cucumis melo var. makuwa]TYK29407.1 Enzymatic polyprotein [Cucumis melo var. makuwa]
MERRLKPVYNQINVISDDKERFREHYSIYIDQWIKAPAETRKPFLTMPDFVKGMLKVERAKNEALVKKLQADGLVAMIKGSTIWVTTSGKEVASNYPPEEEAYFPHSAIPAIKMVSSPYKTINEDKVQTAVERIENPGLPLKNKNPEIPQINPNQPIFQPNSFNIGRLKEDAVEYLAEINKRLAAISLNKESKTATEGQEAKGINMIKKDSLPQTSTSKILPIAQWIDMKNHYSQPSPSDLGWDDLHHEKWTYDAAMTYSARKSTYETTQILILGFNGNLRSWWHNLLTEQDKQRILIATRTVVKTENSSTPIQAEEPDMNKHTTKVIKDSDYRKELGTFCKQYGLSQGSKEEKNKKKKYSSKKLFTRNKPKDQEPPRRRKHYYNKSTDKKRYSLKTNTICFKCNQKGHYANRCPLKDRINALTIDEETKQSLLYAIKTDNDTSSQTESSSEEDYINILRGEESSSEEEFYSQSESSDDEGAIPCTGRCAGKCSGHINVITQDQETLFDLIEQIPDEEAKITCLLKLRKSLEEQMPQKTIQNPIMYSYQDILNRIKGETMLPVQVEDLHHEVRILKREVADNKQRLIHLENAFQASQILRENPETSTNDFERKIAGKTLLIEETGIILGTPFLTQLYPFHVTDKGIISKKFDKEITFEFTHPVTPKYISNIEEEVRQFINRIARKERQIEFLQDDIKTCKVAIEIQKPLVQSKIQNFQKQLEKEVCSNLPNAFWDRKKHMGIIKPIQRSLEFVDKYPDVIQDKTQLQGFLGCVNYIGDFIRDLRSICLPLYDRLKKNKKPWTDEHTRAVPLIKSLTKSITCLSLVDEQAKLIIDTDAFDIGYGGILKQELDGKISIVRYHSGVWNSAQKNYSTVKKEVLAIVLSIQKFQGDLINKEFLVRIDSKASKFIFEKDVKNLISKQIFARWQATLSCFNFKIEPIKGSENSLANYLSREHLLKTISSALNSLSDATASWPATATAAKQTK